MNGKKQVWIWMIIFLAGCGNQPGAVQTSTTQQNVRSATATNVPPTITTKNTQVSGKYMANGHSLYIECLGSGAPTIVLENGEGGTLDEMLSLQQRLAENTTACAYDDESGSTGPSLG